MANELTVSASINYSKGNHQLTFSPTAQQIDVAGEQHSAGVQGVTNPAAGEALALNEVGASSQGWGWFRNIGTSADTHISVGPRDGSGTFIECFQLKGGEFAIMRIGDQQLYAKASTSAEHFIQYSIIEA